MLAKIGQVGTMFSIGAMTLFLGAQHALAQNVTGGSSVTPGGTPNTDITIKKVPILGGSLTNMIGNIVNVILVVVGILAVIYLIYGGIMYVTAGGDAEKASKGRVAITNAIIGIVIIMLALAIYNFVIQGVQTGSGTTDATGQ